MHEPDAANIEFLWGVRIALRDGIGLNATVYLPKSPQAPSHSVFTLTPYISDTYHERGVYFAAHGVPFLVIDVRGRGNSEGEFRINRDAQDGADIVEWLARQPYCNGKVAMWGGSYAGHNQWMTATEFLPQLATIVPVASPYFGADFPMRNNIFSWDTVHWRLLVSGRSTQKQIYDDKAFWAARSREWFKSGEPFSAYDKLLGNTSSEFRLWLDHPYPDAHWDSLNPTAAQYAALSLPILTITGIYDDDQIGALTHYREYMRNVAAEGRARHYLVIGPWDHAGTRTPKAEVGGVKFSTESLLDLNRLHVEWYAWTMQDGIKPAFLKKRVAYYVTGAEKWRYADTLEAVTGRTETYYLGSGINANGVLTSGSLALEPVTSGGPDHYLYDPRDTGHAELESTLDFETRVDQSMLYALSGKLLAYHSAPFAKAAEVSGFFKLSAWLAIDQPDTDFMVSVYEIAGDGGSILLTNDLMRARYRESFCVPQLIDTSGPLLYEFNRFTFVSRQVRQGSRLRLVIGPINSIYYEKNYNAGGTVAAESVQDARPVTVKLYHDRDHASSLFVPFGRAESPDEPAAPAGYFPSLQ